MQIILQEDVEKLGTRGELVEVADGYARNFLLPRKLGARSHARQYEAPGKDARGVCQEGSDREGRGAEAGRAALGASRSRSRARRAKTISFSARSPRPTSPKRLAAQGFHDRQAEDRAGRAHQDDRRIRDSREAAPRISATVKAGGHEGRVALDAGHSASYARASCTRVRQRLSSGFPTRNFPRRQCVSHSNFQLSSMVIYRCRFARAKSSAHIAALNIKSEYKPRNAHEVQICIKATIGEHNGAAAGHNVSQRRCRIIWKRNAAFWAPSCSTIHALNAAVEKACAPKIFSSPQHRQHFRSHDPARTKSSSHRPRDADPRI